MSLYERLQREYEELARSKDRYFPKLVEKVSTVGVDIDTKEHEVIEDVYQRCKQFGTVVMRESKKGYHFKIYLKEKVLLARSFEIRYYCCDDFHRLCRDMLKAMAGCRVIDVLFDSKIVYNENIIDNIKKTMETKPK